MEVLSALSTGSSLIHSSSSPTGIEPGRVEQAPRSIMSAPSDNIVSIRDNAASTPLQRLPEKKESSVRFTIPIISICLSISWAKIVKKILTSLSSRPCDCRLLRCKSPLDYLLFARDLRMTIISEFDLSFRPNEVSGEIFFISL